MFVIVSWAIEKNLSLFRANLVEYVIVKVSWAVGYKFIFGGILVGLWLW